jgi:cyclic pyranopterin phosphate synthase
MSDLTHLGPDGAARMVDVGDKPVSSRLAVAAAAVTMDSSTLQRILQGGVAKGEVMQVARLAGIMAAKRTGELIPLCHPLALDQVQVIFQVASERRLDLFALARVTGRTGVEMEALTAASVAGLTIYDMVKAVDRGMSVGPVRLLLKTGGKTPWCRIDGSVEECLTGPPGGEVEAIWGAAAPGSAPSAGCGRVRILGVPGSMLPSDTWLVFESGARALVADGGQRLEFESGAGSSLPPPGTRLSVRLGDSYER